MYARNPSYSSETGGGVRSFSCPLRIQVAVAQPAKEEAPDRKGLSSSGQTLVEFSLFLKKKKSTVTGFCTGLGQIFYFIDRKPDIGFPKSQQNRKYSGFHPTVVHLFRHFSDRVNGHEAYWRSR